MLILIKAYLIASIFFSHATQARLTQTNSNKVSDRVDSSSKNARSVSNWVIGVMSVF